MGITTRKSGPMWLFISVLPAILAYMALISILTYSPIAVSAHSGDIFGPACGIASLDGSVNAVEWSSASTQTFQMHSPGGADPFTATLYVMNGGYYLYLGITINDDEFSTVGTWLPQGDGQQFGSRLVQPRRHLQLPPAVPAPVSAADQLVFQLDIQERLYLPQGELFDMQRVYTYLAGGRWVRNASAKGQFKLADRVWSVGSRYT